MSTTYENLSYDDFKRLGKEFLDALPTSTEEEAEAGFKCFTIAYLHGDFNETEQYQASIVVQIIGKKLLQKEMGI